MNGVLVVLILVVIGVIVLAVVSSSRASGNRNAAALADAKADARRVIERLGGQVLNLSGNNEAATQALADASERFTAASSQIDQATTAKQAMLAKESAIEGLYYVRAARTAMGMDPGPELETVSGQKAAGAVTEDRKVQFEGREIEASRRRASGPRTTIPAAGSRGVRCRRAGTPSRGGRRHWWPAPGVSDRCCCSTHCSPACTASTTALRDSRTASGRVSTKATTRALTRVWTPAVRTAAGVAATAAAGVATGRLGWRRPRRQRRLGRWRLRRR